MKENLIYIFHFNSWLRVYRLTGGTIELLWLTSTDRYMATIDVSYPADTVSEVGRSCAVNDERCHRLTMPFKNDSMFSNEIMHP